MAELIYRHKARCERVRALVDRDSATLRRVARFSRSPMAKLTAQIELATREREDARGY